MKVIRSKANQNLQHGGDISDFVIEETIRPGMKR
jgi:hypothetical protein